MGFIERLQGIRAETGRRATLEQQKLVNAGKKNYEEKMSLRLQSLDYFLESIYPQLFVDFHTLEQRCGIFIKDYKEEEWLQREGPKRDWIHVAGHHIDSPYPQLDLSVRILLSYSGGNIYQDSSYIPISCSTDGTIFCGIQKMKYQVWKNNPGIQERAFESAYKNPEFPPDGWISK